METNIPETSIVMQVLLPILLTLVGIMVISAAAYFLARPREGSFDWEKHRDKVIALLLVIVALALINWLCYTIGWGWWKTVWTSHKTLFWLTQCALVVNVGIHLFSENGFAKGFAKLLIVISILGWFTVNSFSVSDLIPDPTPKVVVNKVLLLKGDVKEFRLDDIVTMDDLPTILYRVNRQGQFKERKFGEPWNLPRHTNTIEFQAAQDIVVRVRELRR